MTPNNPADYKFKFREDVNHFYEKKINELKKEPSATRRKLVTANSEKNLGETYAQKLIEKGVIASKENTDPQDNIYFNGSNIEASLGLINSSKKQIVYPSSVACPKTSFPRSRKGSQDLGEGKFLNIHV